jgi:AraC-like DNA-binding protein
MTPQSLADRHSVPAAYAGQLIELAKRWGVTAADLLAGSGVSEADAHDPYGRLALPTFSALSERARLLTGEPGLGFYLGLQKRISMYGYLGFAAMSASTLRDALDMFVRFTPTLTTAVSLELEVRGPLASLVVHEFADLGSTHDMALTSLLVGMQPLGRMLTNRDLKGEYTDVALPEPPYFHRFKALVPEMRFDQPVTQIVFDARYLDLPLAQSNPSALQLARDQCERALDALGYDGNLLERARRAISTGGQKETFRSLDEVAATLCVSPRTLKRRLGTYGVTFSSLLDVERREKALALLQSSKVSLESVAEQLGYSTLSSFVRAFQRWTGTTPAAYRRQRGARTRDGGREGAAPSGSTPRAASSVR